MIETPTHAGHVLDHPGTWLARARGYSDFVLRGPRSPRPGVPGPLSVNGLVIPFNSFLPNALLWACDTGGDLFEAVTETAKSDRILVGSFTWAGESYHASFIYFEDYQDFAPADLLRFAS